MYKIAIIEEIHKDGIELLKKNSNFEYEIITDVSEKNLIKKLPDFDACTLRVRKLDSNILKHCQKLKVISRHGVGYDNVDLDFIKKNNIKLLITARANAVAVAEHVLAFILSLGKSIKEYDYEVRVGNFKKNSQKIKTIELFNKEILIAGFGRIGKALTKRCLNFEMKVKVYDPYVSKEIINENGGEKVEIFDEAIKTCDFLSLHMPLTKDTKNMLNYDKIKKMKKKSILINTARGGIINEKDLDKALRENLIFGAGLDVFVNEPIENDSVLLKNNKILLSPHSATFTDECTSRMAIETVKNVIDFFEDKIQKEMIVKL